MSQRGNTPLKRLPVVPPDFQWRLDVPKTRADCPKTRPCPHINCNQHLWRVDGDDMPGRRYDGKRPASDIRPTSEQTCALDIAERGAVSISEIARVLGKTPRRVQQMLKALLALPYVAAWVQQIRAARDGR